MAEMITRLESFADCVAFLDGLAFRKLGRETYVETVGLWAIDLNTGERLSCGFEPSSEIEALDKLESRGRAGLRVYGAESIGIRLFRTLIAVYHPDETCTFHPEFYPVSTVTADRLKQVFPIGVYRQTVDGSQEWCYRPAGSGSMAEPRHGETFGTVKSGAYGDSLDYVPEHRDPARQYFGELDAMRFHSARMTEDARREIRGQKHALARAAVGEFNSRPFEYPAGADSDHPAPRPVIGHPWSPVRGMGGQS